MKYKGLKVLLSCIALYAIQFLIIPLIYKKVYDGGNEAIVVIASTTVLITGVGMFCFSDKMRIWILGMFAYIGLTILYTPPGVYGIGLTGLPLYGISRNYDPAERFFMIAVIVGFVIVLQFTTWCIVKLIKVICARKQ